MIIIMLGGIIDANVPAEAMQPTDSTLSYLRRCISGKAILPKIAAVAIEEPETAPNSPQLKQVATMSDPGTRPLKAWMPS